MLVRKNIQIEDTQEKQLRTLAFNTRLSESEHIRRALNKYFEEVSPMKNLMSIYTEWRKVTEELLQDGNAGSVDCGEQAVREDFSAYAELSEVITFEEMFKLEKQYK